MQRALWCYAGVSQRHLPLLRHGHLSLRAALREGDIVPTRWSSAQRLTAGCAAARRVIARPMIRRQILFLGILLGLAAFAGPASAHLLPAQSGTLHLTGDTVFSVIDIPAGCLPMADDNHDGLIDGAELQRHRAEIIAVFQQRFHVTSDGDPSHSVIGLMLPQADDGSTAGSGYVMAMQRITFKTAPRH